MATLTKVYRVEIQLDNARQQLADANKKLTELDEQLKGLDRGSDAAKAIIAEMAALTQEVDSLTDEVGGLGQALDNLKPGSIGALKEEAERLEIALDAALRGSAEADELIAELGRVKAELKEIDESVDVAFSKDKAGALMDAVSALAGAFTIATVAAQQFGLTQEDADKYNQKLLEMISVVQALEQIHKLTTGEVSTALKSLFGDAKRVVLGYLGIGQASTAAGGAAVTSANVTRIALASLGIGLVLVVLFGIYSNWEKITGAVTRNKDTILKWLSVFSPGLAAIVKTLDLVEKKFGSFSALLSGLGAAFKQGFSTVGDEIAAVLDGDFSGAAKIYENRGRAVAEAFNKGVRDRNNELLEERAQEVLKKRIVENEALLTVAKAQGKDTAELEAKIFRERLATQKRETEEEKAEYTKLRAEYQAFKEEQIIKNAAAEQAEELAGLNARLAVLQAGGRDAFELQVEIKQHELAFLLAAPQRNNAAIIAKEGEISAIRESARQKLAQKEFDEFKKRVLETEKLQILTYAESEARKSEALAKLRDELGEKINAGTTKKVDLIAKQADERARTAAAGITPIGEFILIKLFGVTAGKVDRVKEVMNAAFASIQQSVAESANLLLAAATEANDAALADATARLDEADQKLADASQRRKSAEADLIGATGAKREYLLGVINRERQAEEKLAAQKVKAAREQQAAEKERHRLEVIGQKLSAASTLASTTAAAAKAIEAGIDAVSGANKLPFPGNLFAIVAALAATSAAVLSARNLGKTLKLAEGGYVSGPGGPKEDKVPAWLSNGEFVMNAAATAAYLPELERMNQAGRIGVLPPSAIRRAEGGPVNPGNTAPTGGVVVSQADMRELLAYARATAANTGATAANTGTIADYGPATFPIGPEESLRIDEQKEQAKQVKKLNSL